MLTIKRLETWNWIITAAALATGAGVWLVFSRNMPPQVPMLYSLPWGDEQLVEPRWLLVMPLMALIIGGSFGMGTKLFKGEVPLAAMVLVTSMVAQTILVLGLLRIVMGTL